MIALQVGKINIALIANSFRSGLFSVVLKAETITLKNEYADLSHLSLHTILQIKPYSKRAIDEDH